MNLTIHYRILVMLISRNSLQSSVEIFSYAVSFSADFQSSVVPCFELTCVTLFWRWLLLLGWAAELGCPSQELETKNLVCLKKNEILVTEWTVSSDGMLKILYLGSTSLKKMELMPEDRVSLRVSLCLLLKTELHFTMH